RKHARRKNAFRIGKYGTAANRAARAIDDIVDEVHPAFVRKVLFVDELEHDGHAGAAAGDIVVTVLRHALVTQKRSLVEREFEIDGIGGDDGGEQPRVTGGAAGHEVAGRDAAVADAAIDGRA